LLQGGAARLPAQFGERAAKWVVQAQDLLLLALQPNKAALTAIRLALQGVFNRKAPAERW
jgi:hypothetical protein